jgi:hypothetical protein
MNLLATVLICFLAISWLEFSNYPAHANVSMTEPHTIRVYGEIVKGDSSAFTKYARDYVNSNFPAGASGIPIMQVILDSPGGDVMEALAIGREVRARFMLASVRRQCNSACVFILIAGVKRHTGEFSKIGLHRPAFDPEYFAGLSPSEARDRYNSMVKTLQHYYIEEMGGSPEAFRLIMSTPSTSSRFLSLGEIVDLGIEGEDPAFAEYEEAQNIQLYGRERWSLISACFESIARACAERGGGLNECIGEANRGFDGCIAKAYHQYPNR